MGRSISLALALCALAWTARAGDTPVAATGKGAPIYAPRCATCHDPPQGRIPPRYMLSHKTADQVVQALTAGPMRQQAAGLSADDIRQLAIFITYKRAGAWPEPDPAANRCETKPLPVSQTAQAASDWNGWGRDMENSRFQADPGFSVADVPRL